MTHPLFGRPLPPGYRDELRDLIAPAPAAPPKAAGSILLFQLGEVRLALPASVASAVAPVLHIARIPHRSGTVLLGMSAFRGEIFPCCSLAQLLDIDTASAADPERQSGATPGTARTLILQEASTRRWAVPIDAVLGVRPAHAAEPIELAVSPLAAHWLQGSFEDEQGQYHLLEPHTLFRQILLATA
jgi:chemotaxis-related protein WspD